MIVNLREEDRSPGFRIGALSARREFMPCVIVQVYFMLVHRHNDDDDD